MDWTLLVSRSYALMSLGWPFKSNVCVLYVSNGRQLRINMPGQHSIQDTSMWSNFHHFHHNYSATLLKMCCLILDFFLQPAVSYSMLCLLISITCHLRQPQSIPHASWLAALGLFFIIIISSLSEKTGNSTTRELSRALMVLDYKSGNTCEEGSFKHLSQQPLIIYDLGMCI